LNKIPSLKKFHNRTDIKFFAGPSANANPQYKSQLSLETAEADATISSLLDSLKKDSSSSSKFQNIDAEKMSELFQISSSLTGNCLTKLCMYLLFSNLFL
jgi:hypothetical protein